MENMVDHHTFWKQKKVFITGHTGFKGSWLSLWLQKLGADVCGFALPPHTDPNIFEAASVGRAMSSTTGDVANLEQLTQAMQRQNPDVVFHLAAQALVRPSYDDPVETYRTNVMGTVNLLEAVRRTSSVKAVLIVTSDKCYHNREWVWGYRENDAMGGHDPYSGSKGCAELVTAAYRDSFFNAGADAASAVALASARAGNVIGGGDWAVDRLIPDIIRAFADNRSVVIRYPNAIRPWQHVLDPLQGYLDLARKLYLDGKDYSEAWNFGPPDRESKPVSWVVQQIADRWGHQAKWVVDEKSHPHEATHLKLDCSKAHFYLGWKPRLSLSDALDWTVFWYRQFFNKADMNAVSLKQINTYENLDERQ